MNRGQKSGVFKTGKEVEKVAEDVYFIKQPFEEIFTGVTVVLGKSGVGLIDSGLENTPKDYVFPFLLKMAYKPEDINIVVNTHCDGDHVWGNKLIKEKTQAKVAVHELDADAVGSVDIRLKDGENVKLGDRQFRVVHTPGHTPGSICLYDVKNQTLMTGDSVQGRGVEEGSLLIRTSKEEYTNSMKKLLKLKIAVLVMDHPYKPFAKAILTGEEPKGMIEESIKAAGHIE